MPISHSQTIATKGWLNNSRAETLVSKGWLYIRIEEIPIPKKKRGGSSGEMTKKFGKKEDKKKIIKVTVIWHGKEYVEAKVIDEDIKVTMKDVDVQTGEDVKINIKVEGVKLDRKDIDELN